MTPGFCRLLLKIGKWEIVGAPATEQNCIYLEAPHTSIWDFWIGYLYYRSQGGHLTTMIKKEAFFFPVGCLLRSLGGFPIDRKSPQKTIISIIHEINRRKRPFHLVICPEGTRKPVARWKTGYHTIARSADIPVYITFVDWGHKKVGIYGKVELTDNARADTDHIQEIYRNLGVVGKHPEKFRTQ